MPDAETTKKEAPSDQEKTNTYESKASIASEKDSEKSKQSTMEHETVKSEGDEYYKIDEDKAEVHEFTPVSDKHYNRLGFYCVIQNGENSKAKFDEYLAQLHQSLDKRIKQVNDLSKQNIERIKSKASYTKKKLDKEKSNLENYRAELNELKEKRESKLVELDQLRKRIHDAFKKLADEKRKLIDGRLKERLDEIKDEIKKLIDNHLLLAEKKHEINKKNFDENEHVFKKKVERFQNWKNQLDDSYKLICDKADKLTRTGLSENIVTFLTYVGYFSLIVAGWFFSIFIAERNLSSEDYLSFTLMRIFTFGSDLFASGNKFLVFTYLIFGLLGLLVLVAAVIWLSQWLIDRRNGGGINNEVIVGFNENGDEIAYLVGLNPKSMLTSWLQILPPVFIVGLVFILLSMFGADEKNIGNLLISLSGQFIGAVIALVVSGIAMLYISKIIEPRIMNPLKEKKTNNNLFILNWELFLIIIFFVAQYIIILTFKGISNVSIAVSQFFIVTLFTAFTLGYGFKYRGLFLAKQRMENDLRNLSLAIESNSRPHLFDLKSIEGKSFRKQIDRCQSQFFDMIAMRNHLAKELFFDKIPRPVLITKKIRDLLTRDKDLTLDARELTSIEEKHFPELKKIIDDYKADWGRKKKELEEIDKEIKLRYSRKTELDEHYSKRIQSLEASLYNYQKEVIRQQELAYKEEYSTRKEYEKNETQLKDGYNLGEWYMGNGIGHYENKNKQITLEENIS